MKLKKVLAGLIAGAAVCAVCVIGAAAETYGDYEYDILDDGTVEITKYTGNDIEVDIPAEIDGKEVTSIGYRAFYADTDIAAVTIPDGVTSIGYYAFAHCYNLTSVSIPDSVGAILTRAFYWCDSLKSIVIPEGVTLIEQEAFNKCLDLNSVILPTTLEEIQVDAFLDTEIVNNKSTELKYIGDWLVHCDGNVTSAEIKDGTKHIANRVFEDMTTLESVTFPDSLETIGMCAFYDCTSLTNVELPKNLKILHGAAFSGCKSLSSIVIPKSLEKIYTDAYSYDDLDDNAAGVAGIFGGPFAGSGIKTAVFEEGTQKVLGAMFWYTSELELVYIPSGVTEIESVAFAFCENLKDIYIPDSVTLIGEYAFSCVPTNRHLNIENIYFSGTERQWKNVILEDYNYDLLKGTFHFIYEDFEYIVLDDGTVEITSYTGSDTDVIIPAEIGGRKVTSLGEYAFDETRISSVTIPDSITNIGDYAFGRCGWLRDVYYSGSQAQWEEIEIGVGNEYLVKAATIHYLGNSDTPGTDVPSTDAPETDLPETDTPSTDTPATDTPTTDTPSLDTPSTDEPTAGDSDDIDEPTAGDSTDVTENPDTGIAVSFIPMIAAALVAAGASIKRRNK